MNHQCVLESKKVNGIFDFISKNAVSKFKAAILLLYSALGKSGVLCLVLDLPVHERHIEVSLVKATKMFSGLERMMCKRRQKYIFFWVIKRLKGDPINAYTYCWEVIANVQPDFSEVHKEVWEVQHMEFQCSARKNFYYEDGQTLKAVQRTYGMFILGDTQTEQGSEQAVLTRTALGKWALEVPSNPSDSMILWLKYATFKQIGDYQGYSRITEELSS